MSRSSVMTFDKVYSEFKSTDIYELKNRVPELMQTIFKHSEIRNLGDHVMQLIMGTINCDGELDREEYELLKPLLFTRCNMTYEQACGAFKVAKFGKGDVAKSRKCFKAFPEEVKDAITMICLIFAAVDGNVDDKELEWIKAFAL